MTVVGPIVLAIVIIVAMIRNRRSRAEKESSERAVREQHDIQRRAENLPPKGDPVSAEKN
ncbi:hypothetical protein WP12_17550 [Sphingomonas sp. SRS2]|nr:hypothetical protein WP12_17550 [Sphingomonas sp. SRS2]